jgi:hypothetical protein
VVDLFFCTKVYGYDGQLESFYSATSIESEKFVKYVTSLEIEDLDLNQVPFFNKNPNALTFVGAKDGKLSPFKVVCASYRASFSIKNDQAGRDLFGLYFVTKLTNCPPFFKVFRESDKQLTGWPSTYAGPPYQGSVTYGEVETRLLSRANLSILELYDTVLSSEKLDCLSNFETLEMLGLPQRGLKFTRNFNFPKNIKTLVVRNTELTNYFFEALEKLSSLEKLIIVGCTTSLSDPVSFEWAYDRERSWKDGQRVFKSASKSLKNIIIRDSDPLIFDYLIPESWISLKHIEADHFIDMEGLRTAMVSKESFRRIFPSLETIDLCMQSGSNQAEIKRLSQNLMDQDRGIIVRLSLQSSKK